MNPLWNLIGRTVVALAFGPVDRTARRFERFYAEELAAVESRTTGERGAA